MKLIGGNHKGKKYGGINLFNFPLLILDKYD